MGNIRVPTSVTAPNGVRQYLFSLLVFGAALGVRLLLHPLLADQLPYLVFIAAAAFCAWFLGLGPAILNVVLSLLAVQYFILSPGTLLHFPTNSKLISPLGFCIACTIVLAMGASKRRATQRYELTQEVLAKTNAGLEATVSLRTAQLQQKNRQIQGQAEMLETTNRSLRDLSGRLLSIRDSERRHIARELHDSVGQIMAALGMNLALIEQESRDLGAKASDALVESMKLVEQATREVRTISHLLHPPLLDEAGLDSAMRWYVEGFAERSGVQVEIQVPPDLGRLPSELETAIFRMVQECLTNVHRHSGSAKASVRVERKPLEVLVQVRDWGKGIPQSKGTAPKSRGGVGIRGMQERFWQLGCDLQIDSGPDGTQVAATIPLKNGPGKNAADDNYGRHLGDFVPARPSRDDGEFESDKAS